MMITHTEALSVQLERLRVLYRLLAAEPDSRHHDDLIEQTRIAIAAVKRTRAALGSGPYSDSAVKSMPI
jgi:hypothetical protein